jgi:Ca2+-binding RTX toxin-like protein
MASPDPFLSKGFKTMVGTLGSDELWGLAESVEMFGLAGDDFYFVDGDDKVVEDAAAGTDTVTATGLASYILPDNVENLILDGTDVGGGNALKNVLIGDAGDNILNGLAEADDMRGGLGDDTYYVDNVGDKVTENLAEGTDQVNSLIDHTLGLNLENLLLGGTGNLKGTGNTLNNTITGNAGNNILDGGDGNDTLNGGLGNDDLKGGKGDDALNGQAGNDKLDGGDGNDELDGGDDDDTLLGGAGDDELDGGAGTDSLDGGAGNDELDGGDGNDTLLGGLGDDEFGDEDETADSMTGGAGNDTYWVDHAGDKVVEAAGQGTDSVGMDVDILTNAGTSAYVLPVNVENLHLFGAASFTATGNALDNYLEGDAGDDELIGLAGNDTLHGGAGADAMAGGLGNDVYVVDDEDDSVTENANEGTDWVYAQIDDIDLGAPGWAGVENLRFTDPAVDSDGVGNALNNIMIGNAGDDSLHGRAGNDTLDGGAGADFLIGGTGNDTYVFDDSGDVAVELRNEGTDTVLSSVSIPNLDNNVENATLTGTGNINLTGNGLANVLVGNDGNNQLNGGRDSATVDTLRGGKGNDTYFLYGSMADTIVENANEGTDTVVSAITHTLGLNLENLQLDNAGGNINGTGNTLDNLIAGNTGTNVLTGGAGNDRLYGHAGDDVLAGDVGNDILDGGLGQDAMAGGAGNDVYYVDTADDKVHELAGGGIDTVFSQVDFDLTTGAATANDNHTQVDNVTLLGNNDLDATGNALNNILTGNGGSNILAGNAGDDKLYGLAGADNLGGGDGKDVLEGGDGDDTLDGGIGDDTLAGGADDDTLTGGAGNDLLDGGAGADAMDGGLGNDTYLLDDAGDTLGVEAVGGGIDLVKSSVEHTLGDNYENLTLLGGDDVDATGNALNNILIGNDGNNRLQGEGGADTMSGGKGDDTYEVDNVGDKITENLNEGMDDVSVSIATANYTYTLGPNLEILVLKGNANINGTGNAAANYLDGNSGNNVLDGLDGNDEIMGWDGNDTLKGGNGDDYLVGGDGDDDMQGGAGNDTFDVANAGDKVTELANGGIDTLNSFGVDIDMALAKWGAGNVENLTIQGALANSVTGTVGNNAFSVFHTGDLTLNAGAGNDIMEFHNFGGNSLDGDDIVNGGLGADVLQATIDGLNTGLQVSGIETFRFETTGAASTLDAGWTDAAGDATQRIDLSGDAGITLNNLDSGIQIGLHDTQDVTLAWADATGAGDVQEFLLQGAGDEDMMSFMNLSISGVETLKFTIGERDDDNLLDLAGVSDVETILVTAASGDDVGGFYLNNLHGTETVSYQNVTAATAWNMDGVATTLTVKLNNAVLYVEEADATLTELTLDTSGSGGSSMVYLDAVDAATSLVLQGNQSVRLFDVRQDLNAEDLSNTSRILATDAVNDLLFTGGSGRDQYFGGSGEDTLDGRLGDDLLVGNDGDDLILGAVGHDELRGGADNDTLVGDGNLQVGNDRLSGGSGNDNLTGGAGNDLFFFEHSGAGNADSITDYDNDTGGVSAGGDMIGLALSAFSFGGAFGFVTAGASAALNPDFFVEGGDAADADDYLVWDSVNGDLYYDADGSGAGAKALITSITFADAGDNLTAGDIMVLG